MSKSRKTIIAAMATVAAVALVYNFAVAENPAIGTPGASPADQEIIPSPIPGWVQKEVQIRMPVMVPEGMPVGPPEGVAFGVPPQMPFVPPVPGPDFVPPWVPEWAKQGIPAPPGFPFPMTQVTPDTADPGSLRVQDRQMTDSAGGKYLMRERTWTTNGVPHRELTIVDPPAQTSELPDSPNGPVPPQAVPADEMEAVPDAREQTDIPPQTSSLLDPPNGPATSQIEPADQSFKSPKKNKRTNANATPDAELPIKVTPEKPAPTLQNTPSERAANNELDKQLEQLPQLPPAGMSGIAVTSDPKQGTRIYQYGQGNAGRGTQVFSNIQVPPGAGNMVGVGVSTDSTGKTKVYRYYGGAAATSPSQPAKKATP